jgi:hypothetical protein
VGDLLRREGLVEQVALPEGAGQAAQHLVLLGCFDALGDGGEAEAVREPDDRGGYPQCGGASGQGAMKERSILSSSIGNLVSEARLE